MLISCLIQSVVWFVPNATSTTMFSSSPYFPLCHPHQPYLATFPKPLFSKLLSLLSNILLSPLSLSHLFAQILNSQLPSQPPFSTPLYVTPPQPYLTSPSNASFPNSLLFYMTSSFPLPSTGSPIFFIPNAIFTILSSTSLYFPSCHAPPHPTLPYLPKPPFPNFFFPFP